LVTGRRPPQKSSGFGRFGYLRAANKLTQGKNRWTGPSVTSPTPAGKKGRERRAVRGFFLLFLRRGSPLCLLSGPVGEGTGRAWRPAVWGRPCMRSVPRCVSRPRAVARSFRNTSRFRPPAGGAVLEKALVAGRGGAQVRVLVYQPGEAGFGCGRQRALLLFFCTPGFLFFLILVRTVGCGVFF